VPSGGPSGSVATSDGDGEAFRPPRRPGCLVDGRLRGDAAVRTGDAASDVPCAVRSAVPCAVRSAVPADVPSDVPSDAPSGRLADLPFAMWFLPPGSAGGL
jgi:hypothetical protein